MASCALCYIQYGLPFLVYPRRWLSVNDTVLNPYLFTISAANKRLWAKSFELITNLLLFFPDCFPYFDLNWNIGNLTLSDM